MTDTHTSTAQELAELTGLTSRRIRQLAEEKKLIRVGRGRYDTSFAVNYILGRSWLSDSQVKDIDPRVQAFVGWLAGSLITKEIHKEDFELAESEHWGMKRDEALLSLLKAAAILGKKYDLSKIKFV